MSTKQEGIPELEKAGEDEPVFVLRAQDKLAPIIVSLYALHATRLCSPAKVQSVRDCAIAMRKWQKEHGAKIPD